MQADRFATLVELVDQSRVFYTDFDDFEAEAAQRHLRPAALVPLQALHDRLQHLADWQPQALQSAIQATVDELGIGFGKIGMPLRVALMGHGQSPAIHDTLWLVGRQRSLKRIERALAWIEQHAQAGSLRNG